LVRSGFLYYAKRVAYTLLNAFLGDYEMATQIQGEKGTYVLSKYIVRGKRRKRAYEVVRIVDADTAALITAAEATAEAARLELKVDTKERRPVD